MFGAKGSVKRRSKDAAENPFWISFSDMMTALMVLFLVVMAVALLSIPKKVLETEDGSRQHQRKIAQILEKLEEAATRHHQLWFTCPVRVRKVAAERKSGIRTPRICS